MDGVVDATNVGGAGLVHSLIAKILRTDQLTRKLEEVERMRRDEKAKTIHNIIPICPSNGRIINSYDTERRYDEYEEEMKKRRHLNLRR